MLNPGLMNLVYEPLYNKLCNITNNIHQPSNGQVCGKEPQDKETLLLLIANMFCRSLGHTL